MPKPEGSKKKFDITNFYHLDHLNGLLKVELSELTQTFVECRVEENIKIEKPWIYVEKEKILEHVEFYKENSDFFPIISDIIAFPKDKILLASYNLNRMKKNKFYICGTLDVEKIILKAEAKRLKFRTKTLDSINLDNQKWMSLGSEYYVDCELSKNRRPLVIVELEGNMPFRNTKTHFALRKVENIQNGYIELLNNRSSFNSILRKRLDKGVQSRLPQKSIAAQADLTYMYHKSVQCSTEFLPVKLHTFAFNMTELSDLLNVNIQINLFKNDYKELDKSMPPIEIKYQSTHIESYQDVINCKRTQISCFSWNAIISGIIAAAYTTTPIFSIQRSRPTINTDFDTLYNECIVLIWEYGKNLYPKLYLHTINDITALSFCPYDANILVGGCSNGQIVIWDLTNKLNFKESREFLTDVEQNNRLLITNQTNWFKPSLDSNHPVLRCTLHEGHRDAVTAIEWIPPSKYISQQKTYEDSEPNMPHMQFITASLDGKKILVWDLKIQNKPEIKTAKKRKERMPGVKLSLRDNSPLKELKNRFKPVCQMLLENLGYPVTGILAQSHMYCYIAQNPNTLKDIKKPTYFKVCENSSAFDYSPKLYLTTVAGTLHEATWEPTVDDDKLVAINENCTITKCYDIHDGPILVCEANPYLQDVILTIGGSIFAIWPLKEMKIPIFWRKCRVRCVTGMWSFLHPLAFLVVRSNKFYDIWNIYERSEKPIKSFKYTGYDLTNLYQDTKRLHVQKNTYVITDIFGAFQLYTIPYPCSGSDFHIQESINFLARLIQIKKYLEQLKDKIKLEKLPEITVAEPIPRKSFKPKVQFQTQIPKEGYFKITNNLPDPELRKLLALRASEKINRKKKIRRRLGRRKEIFENAKVSILGRPHSEYEEKPSKSDSKEIKEKYFIEYKKLEPGIIKKIKAHAYISDYNWTNMVKNRGFYEDL